MNKQSLGFIARTRTMRIGSMVLLMVVLAAVCFGQPAETVNLLQNGDFEVINTSLQPIPWSFLYRQKGSLGSVADKKVRSGKHSLLLQSDTGNDICMIQKVNVKPNTTYRFAGWVSTEGVSEGTAGANLSIIQENCGIHSAGVNGTTNWRPIELVFRTYGSQNEVNLAIRLGFYDSNAAGKAYFDDFTLQAVTDPQISFQQIQAPSAGVRGPSNQQPPQNDNDNPSNNEANPGHSLRKLGYPALIILFYLMLLGGFMLRPRELNGELMGKTTLHDKIRENLPMIFAGFAVLTFFVRLPLFKAVPFEIDMEGFKSWMTDLLQSGPAKVYASGSFSDYPPFSLYILYLVGLVAKFLKILNHDYWLTFFIKLPSLILDIATAWLIFAIFRKKRPIFGMILAVIYMFIPAVIYNSSYWGQMDTYYAFLMVLAFYLLARRRVPEIAAVAIVASFFTKMETIVFLPLLLIYLIFNYNWKRCLVTLLSALCTLAVIGLPIFTGKPVLNVFPWIFEFYFKQAATYPYAGMNAGNFMALVGGNYVKDSAPFILGISYYIWGILLSFGSVAWSCYYYIRKRTAGSLAAAFAMIAFGFFMFFPGMNERYCFPVMAFLILAIGYYKDRKLFYGLVFLSITNLLNMYVVILRIQKANPIDDHILNRALYILGIANSILFIALMLIFTIQSRGKNCFHKEFFRAYAGKLRSFLLKKLTDKPFKLARRDFLIAGLLVLIYTIYMFTNLGSWNTPQTGVDLNSPKQIVEIILTQPSSIRTVSWYDAGGSGKMNLEAWDGAQWNSVAELSCDYENYYALRTAPVALDGVTRLRVVPESTAVCVNEIAFFDADNQLVPVNSTGEERPRAGGSGREASKHLLFDEQDRMSTKRTYLNSTYFDEIFHGRTAYEFVKGAQVSETSHPPLGKDILSLGILLFGMNPFGMRFMHAIMGILLMITLFFLGREVISTRFGAYATMVLGMMDFMPFVQSRYSTIDTTSVLFITLMFLFTFRYVKQQEMNPGPGHSLGTLILLFISAGCAAATKWTGIYGIVGVGVCFGVVEFRKYLVYRRKRLELAAKLPVAPSGARNAKAKKVPSKPVKFELAFRARAKDIRSLAKSFWLKNFGMTVLVVVLLFVIIVPTLYYFTYVPFLNTKGAPVFSDAGVREVLDSQRDMYDYHSRLGATHPYTSHWWSWPFDFKPLWLYHNKHDPKSTIVSMGNPFLWLLGLFALVILVYQLLAGRRFTLIHVLFICFLSAYLPWVLVSRITFIYHYYPCLPILYMFIALMFEPFWNMDKTGRKFVYIAGSLSLLVLILFYPAISGMEVPASYVSRFLYWFPKDWIF
jgi:Gpi18-like mannosyltransferase